MNAIPPGLSGCRDDMSAAANAAIFEHVPAGLCLLDRQLHIASLNRRLARMTGRPAEAHVGRALADSLPELFAETAQALRRALAGKAEEIEISGDVFGRAGEGQVILASLQPVRNDDGVTGGVLMCLPDLAGERQRAAAALQESTDHYRHAVELSPHVPWTADPAGSILEAGPRWLALTGMANEDSLGEGWARAVHPEDLALTNANWQRGLHSGEPVDTEYRLRSADGDYRWCRTRGAARRDSEGRIIRWYGTVEDIHDRKLAQEALKESEAFARSVLENSPDCIKVLDLEGRLVFMSGPGLCALEVDDFASICGRAFHEFWGDADASLVKEAIEQARTGRTARLTVFCPTMKGRPKWWDISVSPIPGPDGRPVRLLCVSRDVTEAKRAQDEMERVRAEAQAAAGRLSAVLESTTDSVILVDPDWRMTYVNRHAAAMLAARGLSVGASLQQAFPEDAGGRFGRHCRRALDEQMPATFEEYLSSLELWLEVHACPAPGGLSIFFRDITERRRIEQERQLAQERIAHMARHDALTGLANRNFFREQLEEALAGVSGAGIAVLWLDLDGFKGVNDTFGHPVGDALLCQVADRLRGSVRGTDVAARCGGDEFAVIQKGRGRPENAATFARRLVALLGEPYEIDGQQIVIGASIGIALAPDPGADAGDLIKRADLALYAAKAAGRGTYRYFERQMDEGLRERQALKADLRMAIDRDEFELHFQPILDLRSDRIVSFEALLRWRHPRRGLICPGEFISLAEETGMILPLGGWVLREACREAAAWPEEMVVAVNLSSVQFRTCDLVMVVADTLARSGLAPCRLELEITESVLLQDSDANLAVLHALKKLGIRIAMDDFGTGYSSLGYLRRFPFDKIKIDRSFVSDLPFSGESGAIVRAVVGLGESLGVTVTAEGVETRQQLDRLRAEGCDQAQGFLFSRPVSAGEVRALMERLHGARLC